MKDDKTTDIFTDPLTLDDCDLQTKDGRLRGLEKIAKWELTKPMEKIKAIEIIGKIDGDFVVKTEIKHSGGINTKPIQELTDAELDRVISGG